MNQSLKEFTFILTTITIVGPVVLFFLKGKNQYATEYFKWLYAVDKKVDKYIEMLNPEQKKKLLEYATKYAYAGATWVKNNLIKHGVKPKIADTIVLVGSSQVKKLVEKKLNIKEEK